MGFGLCWEAAESVWIREVLSPRDPQAVIREACGVLVLIESRQSCQPVQFAPGLGNGAETLGR